MTAVEDAVRAWARGSYPLEAGVELLIRQGKAIYAGASWITRDGDRVSGIDADVLVYEAGAWSGGERRLVRIAASLLGGPAADLYEDIAGIDRRYLALVLAAIAHAGGSHEHSPSPFLENPDGSPVVNEDGKVTLNPDRATRLPSLYPWPEGPTS